VPEDEWLQTDVFIVLREALEIEGQVEDERYLAEHIEAEDGNWMDNVTGKTELVERSEFACWMADRIRKKVQLSEPERETDAEIQPLATATLGRPAAEIEVTDIRAFQPPQARTPVWNSRGSKPVQGYIKGDESFALQVCLDLVGADRALVASKRRAYHVQLYARPLAPSAGTIHLGSTQVRHLVDGQFSYQAELSDAALPPGLYGLRVLAHVRGRPPIVRRVEVPLLQVVVPL
jgi:hypothetical protein